MVTASVGATWEVLVLDGPVFNLEERGLNISPRPVLQVHQEPQEDRELQYEPPVHFNDDLHVRLS